MGLAFTLGLIAVRKGKRCDALMEHATSANEGTQQHEVALVGARPPVRPRATTADYGASAQRATACRSAERPLQLLTFAARRGRRRGRLRCPRER